MNRFDDSIRRQVFALESDGAVRTRLTHSLEVAQIGLYIVDSIFLVLDGRTGTFKSDGLASEWGRLTPRQRLAIRSFVEVACLVHDIGNPPFGHFGEKAIRKWFTRNKAIQFAASEDKRQRRDFEEFDGNKQGFRILTRLQRNNDDDYGLNLSYAQLAATIKYPEQGKTKGSVFESEWDIKETIWKELGLSEAEKHPLAMLMEAADDIAYCVSDVEDADAKHLILEEDLDAAFGKPETARDRAARFTKGRTDVATRLVKQAANTFVDRLDSSSRLDTSSLLDDDDGDLGAIKAIAKKRIYSSRIVLANEVTGFKVITGLLDAFKALLHMEPNELQSVCSSFCKRETLPREARDLTEEPAILALFPREALATYIAADRSKNEMFHRCHLLVDFIAGMTDDAALRTYRLISGQATYAGHR